VILDTPVGRQHWRDDEILGSRVHGALEDVVRLAEPSGHRACESRFGSGQVSDHPGIEGRFW
jgi:hypothetical protein